MGDGLDRRPGPVRVTAVLVAHNGARWLPRTLSALASQSRRPDDVLAVDTSSDDDSPAVLAASVGKVVSTGPGTSFLDAVRAGLLAAEADRLAPRPDPHGEGTAEPSATEWVWLLHDDSAPAPDALERLLAAVEVAPSVAIAGCKLRAWDDGSRLLQTGFTVSRLGRTITGVEAGEVDQGQTDAREDVLAVGSAGMLVRRDVWDVLDGPDPATPLVGDDLDLCMRARLAGHRVVVVPGAVVAHADATRTGQRESGSGRRELWWLSRRQVTHRRLVDAPAPLLPLTVLTVLLGGLARALVRMATKEPGRAVGELTAVVSALSRPDDVWRARRRHARVRRVPRRTITQLRATHGEVARWHRDRWQRRRVQRRAALVPVERRVPTAGGLKVPVLGTLVLAAVSGIALRRLVGPGPVSGGALAPAPGDLGQLWADARSTWIASGLGVPGPPDPFWTTLTALSVPFATPALAVTVLLLAAVPLAGLGAWVAAGEVTRSAWLRGWAALVWAAGPPLLSALDDGRLGPVLAHVALPWVALAVSRTITAATDRRSWTAAAAGGLPFLVVATGAPVLLPAGVVALVVVALAGARTAGRRVLALAWTALPALVLSGPWLLAALSQPRVLFAEPGRPVPADAPAPWQLLLAQPVTPAAWPLVPAGDLVAAVAAGTVVAVAALAILRGGPRGRVARAGWLVAAVGVGAGLAATRVVVGSGLEGSVTGWAGAGTTLVLAGLLAAALAGADGIRGRLGSARLGWRPVTAVVVAAVAVLAPVAGLAAWSWSQLDGRSALARGQAGQLPAVATDAATSPDRSRTLVLRASGDGEISATVARTTTELLGQTSTVDAARQVAGGLADARPADPDATQGAVSEAVAALVSGAEDPRPALAALGVGHLLLLDGGESGEAPLTTDVLDGVPGLARAGEVDTGVLWRVTPASGGGPDAVDRAARVRVLGPDGTPQAVLPADASGVRTPVPAGEEGRRLVLAERADAGWQAYVDHRRLEPVVHDGWAQAFELGDEGGELVVVHRLPGSTWWQALQVAVLALTLLLAVPVGGGVRSGGSR